MPEHSPEQRVQVELTRAEIKLLLGGRDPDHTSQDATDRERARGILRAALLDIPGEAGELPEAVEAGLGALYSHAEHDENCGRRCTCGVETAWERANDAVAEALQVEREAREEAERKHANAVAAFEQANLNEMRLEGLLAQERCHHKPGKRRCEGCPKAGMKLVVSDDGDAAGMNDAIYAAEAEQGGEDCERCGGERRLWSRGAPASQDRPAVGEGWEPCPDCKKQPDPGPEGKKPKALTLEERQRAEAEGAALGQCPFCEGGMDAIGGIHANDCPMLAPPVAEAQPDPEEGREPEGTVHELKCWPPYFEHVLTGRKTFEARSIEDRTFEVGDTLLLREFDNRVEGGYTGRSCRHRVTYLLGDGYGIEPGHVVMALADSNQNRGGADGR